jgi:hypothetical protein
MAKAVVENITVPASFTRFVFKRLQGDLPHVSDIVSVDPELAAQLSQMVCFSFSCVVRELICRRSRKMCRHLTSPSH